MPQDTGLSERLRQAREAANLTQQQVADWLGVRRPAIAEIENGTRAVKSDEFVRLASLYGRSLTWFVQGQLAPEDQIAAALFRADDRQDPALHREAARLARRCTLVMRIEEQLGLEKHHRQPPGYTDPDALSDYSLSLEHGRVVAYQERARLGIGLNAPLRDPWGIVEDAGVHVFSLELGKDSAIDGIYTRHAHGKTCVGVNTDQWVFRQVFTVVHEYGHALMDGDVGAEACTPSKAWSRRNVSHEYANRELRANQFAAVFLVPREALVSFLEARGKLDRRGRLQQDAFTALELVRAQDHFGASGDMILWRLRNEGFIDAATRQRLKADLQRLGTVSLAKALGYDWRRFAQPFSRAQEIALRAYSRGHASLGNVAEIFNKPKEQMLEMLREWGVSQELEEEDALVGSAG